MKPDREEVPKDQRTGQEVIDDITRLLKEDFVEPLIRKCREILEREGVFPTN